MYIFCCPGLASCRCRPLSSNVRLQKYRCAALQQEVPLSARTEQPRRGQAADFAARHCAVAGGGQSRRESKQPDFSQGRRERRPVRTHEEAARGGNWKQHPASIRRGVDRRIERRSLPKSSTVGIGAPSKSRVQGPGLRCCKAQSAMQSPQQAPQTRSTATALAVARSGKHNASHANAARFPAARTEA